MRLYYIRKRNILKNELLNIMMRKEFKTSCLRLQEAMLILSVLITGADHQNF